MKNPYEQACKLLKPRIILALRYNPQGLTKSRMATFFPEVEDVVLIRTLKLLRTEGILDSEGSGRSTIFKLRVPTFEISKGGIDVRVIYWTRYDVLQGCAFLIIDVKQKYSDFAIVCTGADVVINLFPSEETLDVESEEVTTVQISGLPSEWHCVGESKGYEIQLLMMRDDAQENHENLPPGWKYADHQ